MVYSEKDKYICTVRSQVRGSADLIVTDITTGESQVWPLRWRQLLMLSYESIKALDSWPLNEVRQSHQFCASILSDESPALEAPASPSSLDV